MPALTLIDYRKENEAFDAAHPANPQCIYPKCLHKVNLAWDNKVLCHEHEMLMLHWFYELDGWHYCPETWDMETGKKLPKPADSDVNMTAYRNRYCEWITSLAKTDYERILLFQIGGDV